MARRRAPFRRSCRDPAPRPQCLLTPSPVGPAAAVAGRASTFRRLSATRLAPSVACDADPSVASATRPADRPAHGSRLPWHATRTLPSPLPRAPRTVPLRVVSPLLGTVRPAEAQSPPGCLYPAPHRARPRTPREETGKSRHGLLDRAPLARKQGRADTARRLAPLPQWQAARLPSAASPPHGPRLPWHATRTLPSPLPRVPRTVPLRVVSPLLGTVRPAEAQSPPGCLLFSAIPCQTAHPSRRNREEPTRLCAQCADLDTPTFCFRPPPGLMNKDQRARAGRASWPDL